MNRQRATTRVDVQLALLVWLRVQDAVSVCTRAAFNAGEVQCYIRARVLAWGRRGGRRWGAVHRQVERQECQ
jgi:hypothetical protein